MNSSARRILTVLYLVSMVPLLFLSTGPALAGSAPGEEEVAAELKSLLNEFLVGASVGDVAIHERFWDEDLVYTSSNGTRFGKAELMQSLREPPPDEEAVETSYWAEEVSVRQVEGMVIVTFRLKSRTGHSEETDYLNTGVFVNRQGQWRATAWHATIASTGP